MSSGPRACGALMSEPEARGPEEHDAPRTCCAKPKRVRFGEGRMARGAPSDQRNPNFCGCLNPKSRGWPQQPCATFAKHAAEGHRMLEVAVGEVRQRRIDAVQTALHAAAHHEQGRRRAVSVPAFCRTRRPKLR